MKSLHPNEFRMYLANGMFRGPYHTDGDSFASLTCRSHPVGPGRVPNMRRLKSTGTLDLPMTAPKSTDEERTRAGWTEIASVITS